MKGFGDLNKSKKKSNKKINISKEQIINQAFNFHSQGNIAEAAKLYQLVINQGLEDPIIFSNYGGILLSLRKLQEAELYTRKAIKIKPDFADAHLNLGSILKELKDLPKAELFTRKAIEYKPNDAESHYNLANILRGLKKLQEAEFSYLKAIELNPDLAKAHSNLGDILKDLGKLQEAEFSYLRAIELNSNDAMAYFGLSTLRYSNENTIWKNQLFSENILNNNSQEDKVNIYFARSNILHKEKKYKESAKLLQLANNLKLNLNKSNSDSLINKSRLLLIESDNKDIDQKEHKSSSESIFILGMPRSGSTLLESILSTNNDVYDLGETNILEESFLEYKKSKQTIILARLYSKKVNNKTQLNITTNKLLYNYQYAGIIAKHIPSARIIHCFRNPLDNILSIYRANFAKGNEYSSCLIDCARVYLDQENLMTKYKKRFRSKIYDFNYDLLVSNPNQEIKSLISWLGWKWDDTYLSPHLNTRSILTASNVQVRSPINSKSIGGWKNYKNMLKPSIEILTQSDRYQDLIS